MNSINRNQPEQNRKDLSGKKTLKQIREVVEKAKTCFFCTTIATGDTNGVRPMNVREVDDEGNFWFLSADDSHTNKEIDLAPRPPFLAVKTVPREEHCQTHRRFARGLRHHRRVTPNR